MKAQIWAIFLVLTSALESTAQLTENFDGPKSFDSPEWYGELTDFDLNGSGQLQLRASQAGHSSIWHPFKLTANWEWSLYLHLKFSPSDRNKIRIYLWSSSTTIENEKALFLEIGEDGPNDAIKLISLNSRKETILACGTAGLLSGNSVSLRLRIKHLDNSLLLVQADYAGGLCFQNEIDYPYMPDFQYPSYFGVVCFYTETRKDKFFMDDIYLGPLRIDSVPPGLEKIRFCGKECLNISFNEVIDPEFLAMGRNIEALPPAEISELVYQKNSITLLFKSPFLEQEEISIVLKNISDFSGNRTDTILSILFPSIPAAGDILINEILFNPFPGGNDFIELINVTKRVLILDDLYIYNKLNGRSSPLPRNLILTPGQIIAFTEDRKSLFNFYPAGDSSAIYEVKLPPFNNDSGNLSLLYPSSLILDELDYHENMHNPLLKNKKGVSLERISLLSRSNYPGNWSSAAESEGFATPGTHNSSRKPSNDNIIFKEQSRVFSPGSTHIHDLFIVDYQFDKTGYFTSASIFAENGRMVRMLLNNQLSSVHGQIIWDGKKEDGNLAGSGIYILFVSAFNLDGSRIKKKFSLGLVSKD